MTQRLSQIIKHDWGYWASIAVATAVVATLTALTTSKDDDIIYTFIDGSCGQPMTSLADVVRSHLSHIVSTNGRFANFLAQLFCGYLGKVAFDVCNAVVFALMLHFVTILAVGDRRPVVVVALASAFVVWSFPNPGETMMWLTGSTNYLWAVTATLALWVWLRRQGRKPVGLAAAVALWLMAAIAGNMNEATSFGFFTGMTMWMALNRKQCGRATVIAMTGYLAGIVLIVASPGAWQRLAQNGGGMVVGGMGLVQTLIQRSYIVFGRSALYVFPALALVWGVWRLVRGGLKPGLGMVARSQVWTVFLATLVWMLLLGVNRSRAFTFYVVVGFVVVTAAVWRRVALRPKWQLWMSVVLFASCVVPAYRAVGVLSRFRAYDTGVKRQIAQAPSEAVVDASVFREENRFLMPVCYNSAGYYTYAPFYCYYFHKTNVQFLPPAVMRRYRSGDMLSGGVVAARLHSNMPDVANAVYQFPGEDFSVVPISRRYVTTAHVAATFAVAGGFNGQEQRRRYLLGLGTASTPVNVYHVVCGGVCYLVLPALPSDIAEITLPLAPESAVASPLVFSLR